MLLYQKQKRLIDDHLQKGIDLFHEGNLELARLSGIRFDKDKYEKNHSDLSIKINKLHEEILSSKEVKLWDQEDFNYDSSKQLRELLYNKCKWKTKNKTNNGQDSVNEETLKKFDKKFTNLILERRKVIKIRDTYLKQFIREAVKIDNDYFIFPSFGLNTISSYRSTCQDPNFMNIPIRNKYAQKMTRSSLVPRKNHQLLELDFKAMEVSISCCYHKDPVMIDYIINNGDMHKDLAKQLFFRTEKTYTKDERQLAKGNFVFAEFYGDTARLYNDELKKIDYGSVTFGLWENMNNITKEHLKTKGIKNIYDFQKHVENIEKDFWYNRFKIYNQWKFDNWRKYKELGYVELYTGFRCNSKLSFNQINNLPIQGTAFHAALKTLIELNKFLRKEKFNSVIIGEIHDSVVLDLDPLELPFIVKQINKIISDIKEEWKWLIVPLKVDFEITGINESWDKKKELII
jgi:DNA polymerase-1